MSLAELIRGKRAHDTFATATPATVATQAGGRGRTVASVATVSVAKSRKPIPEAIPAPPVIVGAADKATASCWWLIHFPDREPVEVASFPPATHADILERHPEAVAAEPFDQAKPEPGHACSTCAHVTGRGGCGEPVAAGLSDVVGVIRYHHDQGASCPAWLATLDGDLERRILAMAERWNYSGDDLALALDGARSDPEGWRRVVETDEREQ